MSKGVAIICDYTKRKILVDMNYIIKYNKYMGCGKD